MERERGEVVYSMKQRVEKQYSKMEIDSTRRYSFLESSIAYKHRYNECRNGQARTPDEWDGNLDWGGDIDNNVVQNEDTLDIPETF